MDTFPLSVPEQKTYELVIAYSSWSDTPLSAITDLLHDFNQIVSDTLRGRIEYSYQEHRNWFTAYEILCHRALVVPMEFQEFRSGDYENVEGHRGSVEELVPDPDSRPAMRLTEDGKAACQEDTQ